MTRPSIFPYFHTLRAVALLVTAALLLLTSSFLDAIAADPPGITSFSAQNEKTLQRELDLANTRLMMLHELRHIELKFREVQSALEAAKDARSKSELQAMAALRSRRCVQLAVNRLSMDALYAPPNVSKRIEELARRLAEELKTRDAELATLLRDAETIRTVGQLRAAAEHLRQIGKSDAAARISREADLLEKEFKVMLQKGKERLPKPPTEDPFSNGPQ